MKLMTLCMGLVVLGCAGAAGEDTEQTETSEQALADNIGHTFERRLDWRTDTGKITQVCTLSVLEPPQPLTINAWQSIDGGYQNSLRLEWNGETAIVDDSIGRLRERVEVTSNCPGAGCRVDIMLYMKGWAPGTSLGCQISAWRVSGSDLLVAGDSGAGVLTVNWLTPMYGYSYRQKLLMNTQETRVGHQCLLSESEIDTQGGSVSAFDVLVNTVSVFDGPTTIWIPDAPAVTAPHPVYGTQYSGHGVDGRGRPFSIGKHTIYRDGTIAPFDAVSCSGQFDWSPDFLDDFDVNVTVLPPGSSAFIVGDDYD